MLMRSVMWVFMWLNLGVALGQGITAGWVYAGAGESGCTWQFHVVMALFTLVVGLVMRRQLRWYG